MVEVYPVRATFRGGASARWGGRSRDGRRGRRARVAGPRRRERAGPTRDAPWPAHAVLRAYSVPACAASSPGTGDPEAPRAAVAPRHTTAPGLMRSISVRSHGDRGDLHRVGLGVDAPLRAPCLPRAPPRLSATDGRRRPEWRRSAPEQGRGRLHDRVRIDAVVAVQIGAGPRLTEVVDAESELGDAQRAPQEGQRV
jgi:hypothetical protein